MGDTLERGALGIVAEEYKIVVRSVSNIWKSYLLSGEVKAKVKGRPKGRTAVQEADIQFIKFLKCSEPTMMMETIKDKLYQFSTVDGISLSTVSDIVRTDLNMTFKRVVDFHPNRYTPENMTYTQGYLDYMFTKDPERIKYMDESGFSKADANNKYGHAEKGLKAVSVNKFGAQQNHTLSLLIGLHGVCYAKIIQGASNTDEYVQFFTEACEAYTEDGLPALSPGDYIVVDNASIHRNEGEHILYNYFQPRDITFVFLPTYSPDFNPVELVFNKLKILLKKSEYTTIVAEDIKVAVLTAVQEITPLNCHHFYRATGTLNM